ncbi:MAG: fibronectin type III domain-containing protein, partial [Chloroflexi bacterium]|nr:fibronectin type III domain-containing protein [Chloroflexota bacterium]
RRWPARRVGLVVVVGLLLLSAVWLGQVAPLLAQEGVGIAFDDLSREPTETTVDRFGVELSNLDAATTYAVVVASDNATALGIGGCGTAAQTQTVTGVTAQDLAFVVYACALGSGTLTAEVRPAGAATAAATVSQALTVLAIPEGAPPGVPGASPASAATRGATKAGTPGIVPNVRFDSITTSSARARWDKPSNGGRALTGFGLLMWTGPDHPNYGDAFVVGKDSRSHTYTGLQAGATYKFRIHACNGTDSCGHWTHPPKEVRIPTPTATATPTPTPTRTATTAPPATTPGPVRNLTHSGSGKHTVSVDWDAPSSSGGATLTGYHVQHKAEGTRDWPDGSDVVTPGTTTAWTIRGLINGTRYEVRVRACNAAPACGTWVELTGTATAGNKVGNASLIPASADLTIGQRQKFEIHDIPVGKTARTYLVGPIQPEGRCRTSGASAQARGPSTGPGYYDSLRIEGCAPGGTGWLRVVNADESELYASAKITVQTSQNPPPERVEDPPPGSGTPVSIDPECPTISGTSVLPANMQVDVVPQSQRRASLCWSPSLFAESYLVQATDTLSNLHDPDKSDWHQIQGTMEQDHVADKAQRLQLNLDQIMTKAGKVVGLAENAAYGIRIGMRDDQQRLSYTTAIIIIDTPITKADGSGAKAEVTWDLVGAATVLNSTNFGTGYYEIRRRQSTVDHVLASWKPDKDGFLPPPSDVSFRVTPSTHVIGGLAAGSVYALQLIYRDDPTKTNDRDADVFAARNAFVWPSTAKADGGQRVAAFPLQQRLGARTADGYPLYAYRICTETFRPSDDTRIAAWVTLINHAMQQWQTATDGLIRTERETDTSGQFKPCADYAGLSRVIGKEIRDFVPEELVLEDIELNQLVQDFLKRFKDTGIILDDKKIEEKYGDEDHTLRDIEANEIIMFNEGHPIDTITRVAAFPEFAASVRLEESCWYFSNGAFDDGVKMCVPGGDTGPDGTRDIFIRRNTYEGDGGNPVYPLAVPAANARFNKCRNQGYDVERSAYGDFLHEVGHVLGIGGSGSGHPGDPRPWEYFDSVMDYNSDDAQPNCAPYPLDIMAIYSLYQVVVP